MKTTIIILLLVWFFGSQLLAWIFSGGDPDEALELWSVFGILIPMGILYGAIWVLYMLLIFPFTWKRPDVKDIVGM